MREHLERAKRYTESRITEDCDCRNCQCNRAVLDLINSRLAELDAEPEESVVNINPRSVNLGGKEPEPRRDDVKEASPALMLNNVEILPLSAMFGRLLNGPIRPNAREVRVRELLQNFEPIAYELLKLLDRFDKLEEWRSAQKITDAEISSFGPWTAPGPDRLKAWDALEEFSEIGRAALRRLTYP